MKTPEEKTIVLSFYSHPVRDPSVRWQVRITFAPSLGEDGTLDIAAEDGAGSPIREATFEFAGRMIPIADGRGTLRYADFVAGKHEKGVWMHRPGMQPLPGGLTFA